MHPECLPEGGWKVLAALSGTIRARGFVLAGGTALALQLGHRISADLDFFTARPFSSDELFRKLQALKFKPSMLQEDRETLTVEVNGVKLSVFHYPYPFSERPRPVKGIPLAGIVDIASMKVVAIGQCGARRDFVDLYFVLRDTPFRKVAENAVARFGAGRINPVQVGKSLVFFNDAEGDPDPRYRGKGVSWETIKRFFKDNIRQFVLDVETARAKGT